MNIFQNILTIKYHQYQINSIKILKNGKLSSSSNDGKFIIYNKIDYSKELEIKECDSIYFHIELDYENLIILCDENKMKIIKLTSNTSYKIFQIIEKINGFISKIIEINNNKFISLSNNNCLKIWKLNDENKYYCIYLLKSISDKNLECSDIMLIKNNELISINNNDEFIKFWEIKNDKLNFIHSIKNINCKTMIKKDDLILIGGDLLHGISIININNHCLKNKLNCEENGIITSILLLSNGNILISLEQFNEKYYNPLIEYHIQNNKMIKIKYIDPKNILINKFYRNKK